jgi:hypothetical protein
MKKKIIIRKKVDNNKKQVSVPGPSLRLNKQTICIEATAAIYMRTGQTICSFTPGSQTYYLNLTSLIVNSNNFSKLSTSGVMNSEFLQCRGMTMKWFPSVIVPVQGTFEPSAFDIRYIPFISTDSILPSGYYGNYNASTASILLQQTGRAQSWIVKFPNSPVVNENNRPSLGQFLSCYNVLNYPSQHGGIIAIIQTTPSLNTITSYNPKLGFLELKFYIDVFNSIV